MPGQDFQVEVEESTWLLDASASFECVGTKLHNGVELKESEGHKRGRYKLENEFKAGAFR